MGKIKVAIICHVSNQMIRDHLVLKSFKIENILRKILGKPLITYSDYGTWNTISLKEYEKYVDTIEMHIIIPHPGMKDHFENFEINGIHYHCFSQSRVRRNDYEINRKRISTLVASVSPDIIVIVGIESPFYSLSALDIDVNKVPLVVVMQTAMSDPDFTRLYPINKVAYERMLSCEQRVIKNSKYIASDVEWHRELAKRINPTACFVRYYFCTDTFVKAENVQKEYDFVYWASNIEKAGMDALKAFVIACRKRKNLTLNLVGLYTNDFYNRIMEFIVYEGLEKNVILSGYFPSHEEALKQVQKSRIALVPIKIDIISSTIREAAMLRMPIVTFITKGTPSMNIDKQCVLLSEINDYESMADNMLRLIGDRSLCESLANNAFDYAKKSFNNELGVRTNIKMFRTVYEHFHNGTQLPEEVTKAWL